MSEVAAENQVTLTIDGREVKAKKGQMLIEVTDAESISVPRFCYHPKLSIAANCRMCLVEVERAPKPLPACATPVADGMVVKTQSQLAKEAQQGTMEFLLINHPLDCPVCDQGGECELQDMSLGYGGSSSRYVEEKRAVSEKDIGPLIATEMTRCIHCTRCVRFGDEIAGLREMGAVYRGEHVEIGPYIEQSLQSELSGNIIDLCPVGALTAKPSRFTGRSWEMQGHASISPHDGAGTHTSIHTWRNQIARVVSRAAEEINETWIADRDRFSYEAIFSPSRLLHPMIKGHGVVDWERALNEVKTKLKKVIDQHGAKQVGVIVSPNTTQEEALLLKAMCQHVGIEAIDFRLRQQDFRYDQQASAYLPWLGQSITELEENNSVLLIGSNIRFDQPMLAHRLRKAALRGAKIFSIATEKYDARFEQEAFAVAGQAYLSVMAALAVEAMQVANKSAPEHLIKLGQNAEIDAARIIEQLQQDQFSTVVLGADAIAHPNYATLYQCAAMIAEATDSALAHLPHGANHLGLSMLDVAGMPIRDMLESPKKAYLLWGIDPSCDLLSASAAKTAFNEAELVIAITAFDENQISEQADIILPMAAFGEFSGTLVNVSGKSQTFQGAQAPRGEARPGWRIARVLCNLLSVPDMAQEDIAQVQAQVAAAMDAVQPSPVIIETSDFVLDTKGASGDYKLSGSVGIYQVDSLVRHAPALQKTPLVQANLAQINDKTAAKLNLETDDEIEISTENARQDYRIKINDAIADGVVSIQFGHARNADFQPAMAVNIQKRG